MFNATNRTPMAARRISRSGRYTRGSAAVLLMLMAMAPMGASARAIRIDTTLAFCNIDETAGAEIAVGHLRLNGGTHTSQSDCADPGLFDAFSLNIGGTSYSTLHLNNDGLITFGGAYSGASVSITDAAFGPAFAPFFTNTPYSDGTAPRIAWGGTEFTSIPYLSINYEGGNSGSYYQVNILDRSGATGVAGDFDLEFNYSTLNDGSGIQIDQGGAQVGFNNGAGQTYLAPGSGVAEAFIGNAEDCGSATISPLALACVNFGTAAAGGLVFEFRNGIALGFPVDPMTVPGPLPLGLLIGGLAVMALRRYRRWADASEGES